MINSFKDKVAVVGMGCTKFGFRYNTSKEDLILEAVNECLEDSGMALNDIDAFWFGTYGSEIAGVGLMQYLNIEGKAVTRIENMCCTGTDAFRNACYAVASGVVDVAMAIGMEKLKDNGYSGLDLTGPDSDLTTPGIAAPSLFALLAPGYAAAYDVSFEDLRNTLSHISYKNHFNGSRNPKAAFRKKVSLEEITKSPMAAGPYLTVMDCSGVSDGCACAIIMRTDEALERRKDPMFVKAISFVADTAKNKYGTTYDFSYVPASAKAAELLYEQAGITNPMEQIDLVALHDCFTITELCLYEDLQLSKRGMSWKDLLDGKFNHDGKLPVNIDGGLKSFGHPIGATGIRMLYENWLQFHKRAGDRQLEDPHIGVTHNLGGEPYFCVTAMTMVGDQLG